MVDKLIQLGHAVVAQELCQASLEEVIARRVEDVLRAAEDQLAEKTVVNAGGGLHD
jgi:hypothetical protein